MALAGSTHHELVEHDGHPPATQSGESRHPNNMKRVSPSPSPPPTLPVDAILPTRSGSPPPKLPPNNDDEDYNDDEGAHEDSDDKEGVADSSESSSADSSELVTPPTSIYAPTVQVVNDNQTSISPDSYPPLPPIPKSTSPPPGPPRRAKSTGILNYPSDYSRSRACSLPSGPDHQPCPSSSTSSFNVKFAPLPQLAPRKRKSNTPLGVAARGQLMAKRRQIMMQNRAEAAAHGSQQNMFGDVVEISEESEAAAAAQARARARNGGGYGVDEDGEEMEDPFVALGRMFKGAWRRMKGKGEKETSVNAESRDSGDKVNPDNTKSSQPGVVEQPTMSASPTKESPSEMRSAPAEEVSSTQGRASPGNRENGDLSSQSGSLRRKTVS